MLNSLSLLAQSSSGDDAAATAAGLGISLFMLFFWLVFVAAAIAGLVLWIISLIHVIQHDDVKDRTMWILLIVLLGTIGGVIYFFAVKKAYDKGGARELPRVNQ